MVRYSSLLDKSLQSFRDRVQTKYRNLSEKCEIADFVKQSWLQLIYYTTMFKTISTDREIKCVIIDTRV